jgi:radical SAM PhpK family P-methyltransferase
MKSDCIIIGYNDVDFNEFAQRQKQFSSHSGAYNELKSNSLLLDNKRRTYMELLNQVRTRGTGEISNLNAFEMPNLGVAYLTSFLARRGISAEPLNFFNFQKSKLIDLLADSPHAVVITTTYYIDDEPIKQIVNFVREYNPKVKIIVGGPRIYNICTASKVHVQDLLFKAIGADIYINDSQGEASLEKTLVCLKNGTLDALDEIPNLVYQNGDGLLTRTNRIVEDNGLDENAIDWSYFDPDFYRPTAYMRTARSCPFSCAFCNYPSMAGTHVLSSIETIEAEMQYLHDHGVKNIIFIDDTFNVPLGRFKDLCRMMIRNQFNFNWLSFFRCSNADDETFDLMKQSGCIAVYLGIESGDQQILKNMNKFANLERYKYGIQKLTEHGILSLASLIVGFPGETKETVLNTINFLQESPTTFYNVQLYYHNPLAPIQNRMEEFGITGSGFNWRHNSMSWQEASEWMDYMIENIDRSLPLPLYGFSIWSVPYLMNHMSIPQILNFAKEARGLLIRSLADEPVDFSADLERMSRNFQTTQPMTLAI